MVIDNKNKNPREIMEEQLLEIRCPFERVSKSDGKLYKCNSLCVKVGRHSYGETRCRKCHLNFAFSVNDDGMPQTGVKVKPIQ